MNIRLRMALQKARDANMPNDNVERAIRGGLESPANRIRWSNSLTRDMVPAV